MGRETTVSVSGHLIHISLLTAAEIASALARRHREGSLSASERDRLFGVFLVDCAGSFLLLRVEEDVIQRAVALMNRYPLRTADAIQVSTAILLSRTLHEVQFGPVIVASADDRVLQAAAQEGLPIENPNLHGALCNPALHPCGHGRRTCL
ncbi:MAG: type II toxin-antitoxin system VapC family toxin [Candidatus Entotheonellia bacterium]